VRAAGLRVTGALRRAVARSRQGATDPTLWPRHSDHEVRSAALVEQVCVRLRVPGDCRDLAAMAAREHGESLKIGEMQPGTVLELFERCDALRRPERFALFLDVCEADFRGRLGHQDDIFVHRAGWERALLARAR